MFSIKSTYILFVFIYRQLHHREYTYDFFQVLKWLVFAFRWGGIIKSNANKNLLLRASYFCLSRYCFFLWFSLSLYLSLFSLCITDSPLAQAPQMMLRLRNWFYLRLCVLFFCAQNWATLTNHFEKSDFVRIIHLFNSWDLFTFSSIHSSPFALSLSLSRLPFISFFLSGFFSYWLSTAFKWNRFLLILLRVLLRIPSCGRSALSPLFEQVNEIVLYLAQLYCSHSTVWFSPV